MDDIFLMLFLLSFLGLVIGLVSPKSVVRWGSKRTRGRVLLIYGLAMLAFFVLFGVAAPPPEEGKQKPTAILSPAGREEGERIAARPSTVEQEKSEEGGTEPESAPTCRTENTPEFLRWLEKVEAESEEVRKQGKATSFQKPTSSPAPQMGAQERLKYEVKQALGACNRNVAKVSEIEVEQKSIYVMFAVDDNLTEGMIERGARMDIVRVLKAVQSSGYDYSEIVVVGTFLLVDKFGNSQESKVLVAAYKRSTVDRINWQGFLTENTYDIAESVWLHRAFK